MIPLPPIVLLVLLAYFGFSVWNAYSAGCNMAMLRKHKVKGVIKHGPYLSLAVSFLGIMLAVFLFYEIIGYYSGFIWINLPGLSSLDFFTFLIKQFSEINLKYKAYVEFLILGLAISSIISLLLVEFLYKKGQATIKVRGIKN